MRGIYKRGGIYWIRYAGLDGKIIFESSGSKKFKDAEALLIQRKQEVREGKQPIVKKIPNYLFKDLAERYLLWVNGRQKTAKIKGYIIRQLLDSYSNLQLKDFTTLIVEQLQTNLINRGLKNSSCNKVLNILKHMFTKAVEWEMVSVEVLKRIRAVKLLPDNSKRLRYLSQEECWALINACEGHLKPIVITALSTGMRKSEILKLKWKNVDLRHGFISLEETKNGERREIPINNTLRSTLQGLPRRLDVPYVFYDPTTTKPYQDIKRSFHTAIKKAGIKDFHFHDLRHTFASHLVMRGVDLTTVSKLLGHKSLTMTLRYAHLAPNHLVKAVGVLDNVFKMNYTKTIQSGGVKRRLKQTN